MTPPVYLIDDDNAVREGIALLFEAHGLDIETFEDPLLFLDVVDAKKPGYLLIDLQMPHISGLELHQRLLERGIAWPSIVITGHGDIHSRRSALQSGIVDFLTKPIDAQRLFAALKKAKISFDASRERLEARALVAKLTLQESEILNLICRGAGTIQIAEALAISSRMVARQQSRISEKLGAASIAELLQMLNSAEQ